jgi:hypothetical protein
MVPGRGVLPPDQAEHPITTTQDFTATVQPCVEPRLEVIYAQMRKKIHAELLEQFSIAHEDFLREAHGVLDSLSEKMLSLYPKSVLSIEPAARIAKPRKRGVCILLNVNRWLTQFLSLEFSPS